jgi:prepilin-type N-terminal cleavage/methylation domain-containing protein
MTQKGFTLIELLVVVAIIGVLAAVGVVAFNGFINNSKINTVKANHKSVVKYIQTEFIKCDYGGEIDFHERWKRGEIQGDSYLGDVNCARLASINQSNKMKFLIDYIMRFLENYDVMGFTNPFNPNFHKETGVGLNDDCPRANNSAIIGETWCGYDRDTSKVHCCSRFGLEESDILQTYINDPF